MEQAQKKVELLTRIVMAQQQFQEQIIKALIGQPVGIVGGSPLAATFASLGALSSAPGAPRTLEALEAAPTAPKPEEAVVPSTPTNKSAPRSAPPPRTPHKRLAPLTNLLTWGDESSDDDFSGPPPQMARTDSNESLMTSISIDSLSSVNSIEVVERPSNKKSSSEKCTHCRRVFRSTRLLSAHEARCGVDL
ncbi:unnamed protein product [Caenorhabditis sp. 36 PRJEB53466]|nr:unnamed protein product [Caenorhabditis sp. 36 PRJEB53466]